MSITFQPQYERKSDDIYVCWFQGIQEAPPLVKLCYSSLRKYNPDKKIHFITNDNLNEYTEGIPDNIMDKYHNGIMSKQDFSDILRSYLLSTKGGFWVDATLLVLDELPSHPPFYTIKKENKKSSFVSRRRWTSYYVYSVPGSAVMTWWYKAMCLYFEKTDIHIDYWLSDAIIDLGYDVLPDVRMEIDSVEDNNECVSAMIHKLNDIYDGNEFRNIIQNTKLFKLDWRYLLQKSNRMTYFDYLSNLVMQ